ncbi:MAG TPA: hypothetical protein VFA06_08425 [Actinocrinis sp.]|uniref:hypothetical protein n=1 Tax=Actinocrinis sp. TaxID=1920516 RepID=UPI002D256825|nr:hypothetical protein [Actinocrinis sp.]HZU55879.1 hypothetical protein [Actinocrinis sp.]
MESRTSPSSGRQAVARSENEEPPSVRAREEAGVWTPEAEHEAETEADATAEEVETGAAGEPPAPWFLRSRGRSTAAVAAVLAVVAALLGISRLAPVHTVLRQSFTEISSPNTQFYLNGNPWISGQFLNVPLGVIVQNDPSVTNYRIHVWTVDGSGKADASTTVTLPIRDGRGTANYQLPIPVEAQLVWAAVEGTPYSLHYRFAGSALPSAHASSTR